MPNSKIHDSNFAKMHNKIKQYVEKSFILSKKTKNLIVLQYMLLYTNFNSVLCKNCIFERDDFIMKRFRIAGIFIAASLLLLSGCGSKKEEASVYYLNFKKTKSYA